MPRERDVFAEFKESISRYRYHFVAAALLLTSQLWWTPPHFLDAGELTWNIGQQAASHATVLSILAAVTTLFISFTVGRYMELYEEKRKQRQDAPFHLNASMGGAMLLFSLSCFGIAAFICAVLSGYPAGAQKNPLIAYAVLANVYILYAFGFILTLLGGLYAARVFGFGLHDTRKYCWIVAVISALVLSAVHQHISLQVYLSRGAYRDWLWFLAIAIILLHEPVTRITNLRKWLAQDRQARLLVWLGTGLTSLIPLTVVVVAFFYLNIHAFARPATIPGFLNAWYILFYPVTGLYLSLMIALFSEAMTRIHLETL